MSVYNSDSKLSILFPSLYQMKAFKIKYILVDGAERKTLHNFWEKETVNYLATFT